MVLRGKRLDDFLEKIERERPTDGDFKYEHNDAVILLNPFGAGDLLGHVSGQRRRLGKRNLYTIRVQDGIGWGQSYTFQETEMRRATKQEAKCGNNAEYKRLIRNKTRKANLVAKLRRDLTIRKSNGKVGIWYRNLKIK